MRPTITLVDFSGLAWTCYEPALSAQRAGEEDLARHREKCAVCELGEPCTSRPRQYDAKDVLLTNIDLKFETLAEAIQTPVKTWVMVLDGQDDWRRKVCPQYKGNREKKDYDPRPRAEQHVRGKGCRFVVSEKAEADDAIATMALQLRDQFDIVVVSSDKDLWAVWDPPAVRVYLPVKKAWLDREYMEKRLRVDQPRHIRLVKALWGDPSDNLPNCAPRTQAQLVPLIKQSDGTLDHFLALAKSASLTDTCRGHLNRGLANICGNYQVVGLLTDVPIAWLE